MAAAAGVPSTEPRVLADGVNVVVHLGPAPLVARVATVTADLRPDPAGPFGREVALAGALAAAGAAVVPPSDLVPAGPHVRDGLVLSFWRWVEVRPERPGPAEVARALAALREHLDAVPPPAGEPLDRPLEDLTAFAADGGRWGASAAQLGRLRDRLAELRPRLAGPATALHGDAHPGNLLATADGWRWTDLEDTCPGPPAWDLACLRLTSRLDGRAALDALPGAPSDADLAPWLELRRMHAAVWTAVLAVHRPAHRAAARERLTAEFG
ncbi:MULTISPECIES: phosphotransferase family protein [unclassified Blastococcus]